MMNRTIPFLFFLSFLLLFLPLAADAQEPSRYISLAPATTEILFALGLNNQIVGVSSSCDYPAEAKEKQDIGSFSQPNMELILAVRPDYIFCTGLEQSQAIDQMRALGLAVYVSDPRNFHELYESIRAIGIITHRKAEAEALVSSLKAEIALVQQELRRPEKKPSPRVFVEIWSDPLTTAGPGSFIDEVIHAAGGINIAYDTLRPYSVISSEVVIQRDPECIIFTYMDPSLPQALVAGRPGWESINAVQNGRIYNDIDPNVLLRPGPRLGRAVREVYKRLYEQ